MKSVRPSIFNLLILLTVLPNLSDCVDQMANYPLITTMKSGDHKLLTATTTTITTAIVVNYTQPYSASFTNTSILKAAISIRDMQIANTSKTGLIDYSCSITGISTSQFFTILTINPSGNTFGLLYYMYIVIDIATIPYTYLITKSLTFSQFDDTPGKTNLTFLNTATIFDPPNAVVVPYVMSFKMNTSTEFSYFVSAKMQSSTVVVLNTTSNSFLQRMELTIIMVDKTKLEENYTYFIDFGIQNTTVRGGTVISTFNPASFNYFNYLLGLGEFRVDKTDDINFFMWTNSTFLTFTSFKYLSYYAIHWRNRSCINSTLAGKFILERQICSTICPPAYNTTQNLTYCIKCHYSCASCNRISTQCTNCTTASNRQLDNSSKTCSCMGGFYEDGNAVCPPCNYSCLTCSVSATNCTSCNNMTRNLASNKCLCLQGYFEQNNAACSLCDYTCKNCNGPSPNNCTECDITTFRLYDDPTHTCTCKSGYKDNNTVICISTGPQCISPCLTCNNTGTNCLTCLSNRTLTKNTCPCKLGFTAINNQSSCFQQCGTGQMIPGSTKGCDDGDRNGGDGCSADCMEEAGFSCNNSVMPSVCLSKTGYSFSTQSVQKDKTSNTLTAVLQISPNPPASATPALLNLQDSLSLISYSLINSTLTLKLNMLQSLDNSLQLKVQLSKINAVASISLSLASKVELVAYVESYYTLYNIEVILVWLYIALLWLASIYRVISQPMMISQVTQVFLYSGLAWIGVQGQQTPMLLFTPLQNFKYLFGYNIKMENKSLFSVFNISFGYVLFPALLFLVLLVIGKKRPGLVTTRVKRFVLYDLSYAWLTVNGLLLSYGASLCLVASQRLSGVQAGGLVLFAAYLVGMSIVSYKSFFRGQSAEEVSPSMQYTKKNLFKHKVYPIYLLLTVVMSFIYLVLQKYTQINPLFAIGYYLVLMVLFGVTNVFINKVRNLLNLISLILIYSCYLLINQISTATWTGFVVISLLYVQLITNFVIMFFEKTNLRIDADDQQILKDQVKPGNNLNDNRENVNDQSDRGVIQLEDHDGVFEIYEPPTPNKDRLQIIIPSPQAQAQDMNMSILKPFEVKADRQRISEMKQALNEYLLTTPKYKLSSESKKQQPEQLIDVAHKEVEMNEF